MGNTCCACTDTSTDGIPNGKLGHEVEDYPLKGGDSVELPHISERELGMYIVRFRFKSLCTWKILIAEKCCMKLIYFVPICTDSSFF